jgi:hypothetical protein
VSTTPLTAQQLFDTLKREGVDPKEFRSWRTHGRDSATGKTFGPVHGVVIHHTAGTNSLDLVYDGTSSLPGPLCHTHLSKTGVATMISAARANHAGTFAQNAHDAVLAEDGLHPYPDAAEPVDGNDHYYGIEIENLGNGADVYPWVQYVKSVKWATAICRAHGWSQHSVIGHREGTRRKIDPKGPVETLGAFDMNGFRMDVREALALPAGVWPNQEEDVALTDQEKNDIAVLSAQKVWGHLINNRFRLDGAGIPRDIPAALYLEYGDGHYDALDAQLTLLSAKLDALKEQVETVEVGGVDLDSLAVKVADELYRRMQS